MVEATEPLESVRILQRDAVIVVAVFSSVSIIFAILQLLTLHEEGIFTWTVCLPAGMLLLHCQKWCGTTEQCVNDRITQRIVLSFYSVMAGVVVALAKVIFVSIVTARVGAIRSTFALWNDGASPCSDEAITNEVLSRVGTALQSTFNNNLVAICTDCFLLLSSASTAWAEMNDGKPLCRKTISEANEL
jgi:hypothetical protein